MKLNLIIFSIIMSFQFSLAQTQKIYATIEEKAALELKNNYPNSIEILNSKNSISAVYIDLEITTSLKGKAKHGPGYIIRNSESDALQSLEIQQNFNKNVLNFNITETEFVNQCLNDVDAAKIGETILELQNYGTRFHNVSSGIQVPNDLAAKWQSIADTYNRPDVNISLFNHSFSQQKSVIIEIPGSENPDEIVIVGAHLDSGDFNNRFDAPGADDNASGVATITEIFRVLLHNNFHPKRTVQIMAFAAEEIGLMGSQEIANQYKNQNKNVLGITVFDMVNYHGSNDDIFLVSDPQFTSSELNLFLVELMEHYNSTGNHTLTYQHSECGYACSDHASWSEKGYMAVYPFESAEEDFFPYYHSPLDTFENMNSDASHSAKFAKLGIEFLVEIAKQNSMNVNEVNNTQLKVYTKDQFLHFQLPINSKIKNLNIVNTQAQSVFQTENLNSTGKISIQHLPIGIYVVVIKDELGKIYTQKFIKN